MVYRGGPMLTGVLLLAVSFTSPSVGSLEPVLRVADSHAGVVVRGKAPRWRPPTGWHAARKTNHPVLVDFDCDTRPDLATSSPSADVPDGVGGLVQDAGAVFVAFGTKSGSLTNGEMLTIDLFGITPRFGDQFGVDVAVGYINGDKCTDLVVGANGFNGQDGTLSNAGGVFVFLGSLDGLVPTTFFEGTAAGELLGTAVALGNFDGKQGDDLAVSSPGKTIGGLTNAGGLTQYLSQVVIEGFGKVSIGFSVADLKGKVRQNDYFAWNLDARDVNGDGFSDLVAGSEFANQGRGTEHFLFGTRKGLLKKKNQLVFLQNGQIGDQFGHSTTLLDLNGDGYLDPVIGAPFRNQRRGIAVGLLGGNRGVTSSSLVFEDPAGQPGDAYGWALAHAGSAGNNVLFFGTPGADPTLDGAVIDQGGGVAWTQVRAGDRPGEFFFADSKLKIARRGPTRLPVNSWNDRPQSGYSLSAEPRGKAGQFDLRVGIPGFSCDGVARSGAFDRWVAKFEPAKKKLPKILATEIQCYSSPLFADGSPQEGAEFGRVFPGF